MTDITNRIIIFANGELPEPKAIGKHITNQDFLIAADGGLHHLTHLGLVPHLIIGDLDSTDPQKIQEFKDQGVNIQAFSPDKDETDLELALEAALTMQPNTILIVAALGGRLDMTLANIFMLTRADLVPFDVRLWDGQQEVFIIRGAVSIKGTPGERVSLLPLFCPATGITTEGLKFPLDHETLFPDRTRGISNRLISSHGTITIETGMLLCVHELNQLTPRSETNG